MLSFKRRRSGCAHLSKLKAFNRCACGMQSSFLLGWGMQLSMLDSLDDEEVSSSSCCCSCSGESPSSSSGGSASAMEEEEEGEAHIAIGQQMYQAEAAAMEVGAEAEAEASQQGRTSNAGDGGGNSGGDGGSFDCHICLEVAREPVVTVCGHLFCWPCIYRWLEMHSLSKECPVCKASLGEDHKIVPLYGRGKKDSSDPTTASSPLPQRPPGLRTDTPPPNNHTSPTPLAFEYWDAWPHVSGPPFYFPYHHNLHFPHPHPLFDPQFNLDNDFFATTSSSSSENGGASREGLQSRRRHQPSTTNDQREALLYRLYIALVCVVIVLIVFF